MNAIRYFQLVILIFAMSFFSCKESKMNRQDVKSVFNLDIRAALGQENEKILLSNYGSTIKYIQLETSEFCLLSAITDLCMTEKYIFILDAFKLYQFDTKGRFIRQVGRTGEGPGENSKRIKFTIDEFHNEIFVFSYPGKVNVYNSESGEFVRDFKINLDVANLCVFPQGKLTFFTKEMNALHASSPLYEIYFANTNGSLIDSIPDFSRSKNRNNVVGYVYSYKRGGELFYMGAYKDTLYELNEKSNKSSYAIFNLNNKTKWEDLIIEPGIEGKFADFINVFNILETNKYIFLEIQVGISSLKDRIIKNMVFDKNTQKLSPIVEFINDIDGGMPFWPKYIANKETLIGYYYAHQMIDLYNKTKNSTDYSNEFTNLMIALKEKDNPVLMIVE